MTASKAKQAATALRRGRHLELALAGMSNAEIAETLREEGHEGLKSPTAASKDMCRILNRALAKESLNVEQYRKMNERRLLAMIKAVWPKAADGDLAAVEQVRKLTADLTKLFGLEEAAKTELSGPGGGPLQLAPADVHALHRLIGMAGEPDADDGDGDDVYDGEKYEDETPDADSDGS